MHFYFKLFTLCCTLSFSLLSNFLLQSPSIITESALNALNQDRSVSFTWRLGKSSLTLEYYHNNVSLSLALDQDTYSKLNKQTQKQFTHDRDLKNFTYVYNPFDREKRELQAGDTSEDCYALAKPHVGKNRECCQIFTLDQLADYIKTKNCIIYTGAGVSAASNIPVMHQLETALELDFENKTNLEVFVQKCVANQQKISGIFKDFVHKMQTAEPTPAHYALKEIATRSHTQILTENLDILHQKTGIIPLMINPQLFRRELSVNDLKKIDAILCIGLSHDDRGFLAWYKEQNPEGIILALNLEKPPYIDARDIFIRDDLQVLLPKLCKKLYE